MKRHAYQTEMLNWCETLKEQVIQQGRFDRFAAQIDRIFHTLQDDGFTEAEWYEQASALYRDITEPEEPDERRAYVPIGKHVLPKLPYSYSALEPYISREIMKLHHTKHHQSYVDGLNKAELELKKGETDETVRLSGALGAAIGVSRRGPLFAQYFLVFDESKRKKTADGGALSND